MLFIGIMLFAVAALWLVIGAAFGKMSPQIIKVVNDTEPDMPITDTFNTFSGNYNTLWDRGYLFLVFGLSVGALIAAFFVKQHPVFFWTMAFVLVVFAFLNMFLSNVYQDFASNPELASTSTSQGITFFVMEWLPFMMLGLSGIIVVAQYMKTQNT